MDGIPWLSWPKMIYVTVTERNGKRRRRLALPEQKKVGWTEDLVNRFLKSGEMVVDLF